MDTPLESPAEQVPVPAGGADAGSEQLFSLFTLELAPSGPLVAGRPVELEARVRANAAASDVRIRLVLPEVESARMTGTGDAFRLLRETRFPARMEATVALTAGQEVRRTTRVQLPGPGYYRAVLSAEGRSAARADGRGVQPFASREIWLAVSDRGIQVTDEFDAARVPAGVRAQPGPHREKSRASRAGAGQRGASTPAFDYTPPPWGDGQYNGTVMYYDDYDGLYRVVPGVEVTYSYFVYDYSGWEYVGADQYLTSQYGSINFHCNLDGVTRQRLEIDIALIGTAVEVPGGEYHDYASSCSEFQLDYDMILPKHHARAFLNLRETAAASASFFGVSRYQITANVVTGSSGGGKYTPSNDQITLYNDAIWGPAGVRLAAHQYGHATHWKVLGGYINGTCPSLEPPLNASLDPKCAYAEGFAEFYAAALRGSAGDHFAAVRTNPSIFSGMDGSVMSGPIASFLYDLYDSADDAGETGAGRYFDNISVPGTYLAQAMRTCKVTLQSGAGGNMETIDRLIACLGNDTNIYTPSYFPSMQRVTAFTEQAAEPTGWTSAKVRSLWLWNLYGQ